MFSAKRLLLLLLLLVSPLLRAAMDLSPPAKISWNGFIHDWVTIGENPKKEYANSGDLVKRFRFKMNVEAYDGLNVVLVPELAGQGTSVIAPSGGTTVTAAVFGFTLLDAYATIDLSKYLVDMSLPLTVTIGQFKTPFGLNRMYTPSQLTLVDYSSIYNGAGGVMQTSTFWDDGLMLTYKLASFWNLKADAAWVEGLGIDQPTPGGNAFGSRPNQDFVGRLEVTPLAGLTVGGSYYNGEAFGASGTPGFPNKPKNFSGAFVKYAMFGKSFAAEAEFINRDLERLGLTIQLSQYVCDSLQLAVGYDHVTMYQNDKADNTRYMGGLNWFPGGPLRFSLMQLGTATGVTQSPSDTRTILQTQVTW